MSPIPTSPATTTPSTSTAASVEFRSAKTRSEWKAIGVGADNDEVNQLRSFISGMMTDENLVIMTGLGTSLCVTDWLDKKLAPTMGDLWIVAEKTWRKVIKETWEGDDDVPQDRVNINDLC